MKKLLILSVATVAPLLAQVDENISIPYVDFPMVKASGVATYQSSCIMCHSLGYIDNQGLQSKAFWRGKVDKMIVHFKAPITVQDADTVTNYLFKNYGNGKLK
ncbi:MAG: Cytochrome c551/c552 [uncultured Sulfurovum sp.]|uniref:Cytochrome c551/c552 n=1 Tax=uncultured Sulfurovum sp. TaxID=269237 RepID=A0A6S6RZB5_9BACT|nr:MAG: Cytochrome c551/c552 [uncultured Sulfurovum sp.]